MSKERKHLKCTDDISTIFVPQVLRKYLSKTSVPNSWVPVGPLGPLGKPVGCRGFPWVPVGKPVDSRE